MLAPMWQYFTMLILFSLAFIFNVIGIAAVVFAERKIMTSGDHDGAFAIFFRVVVSGIMMYASYSLFEWYTGPLGLGILLVHWSSVISTFIYSLSISGRKVEFTFGKSLWGTVYTAGMLISLIVYGLTCL